MPSSSRLDQLRRQRALLQEHVTWLDREIAAEMVAGRTANSSGPVPSSSPAPAPSSSASLGYRAPLPPASATVSPLPTASAVAMPAAPTASTGAHVDVDELFDRLRADDRKDNAPPSRTGCWVAFAVILLVLIGSAGALIFFLYR
jgi:hypothetical protein